VVVKEIGCEGMDWILLAQDRDQLWDLVNTAMNLRVSQKVGNLLTIRQTVSSSRRTLFHAVA